MAVAGLRVSGLQCSVSNALTLLSRMLGAATRFSPAAHALATVEAASVTLVVFSHLRVNFLNTEKRVLLLPHRALLISLPLNHVNLLLLVKLLEHRGVEAFLVLKSQLIHFADSLACICSTILPLLPSLLFLYS